MVVLVSKKNAGKVMAGQVATGIEKEMANEPLEEKTKFFGLNITDIVT